MNVLQTKRILVIGMGNMATALIKGLVSKYPTLQENITAVSHGEKSADNINKLGLSIYKEDSNACYDIVLLGLKPQIMCDVLTHYKHLVSSNTLFVSIAAGLDVEKLQKALGVNASIVRAMPNTPAAVGKGMTGLYASENISALYKDMLEAFFGASGSYIWLEDEEHMHIVTALSGSGPAYFFYFIEGLAKGAMNLGMNKDDAYKLAITGCMGAGAYASSIYPEVSIEDLRKNVTSSGGTTEAGLKSLKKNTPIEGIVQAVENAYKTSKKLNI